MNFFKPLWFICHLIKAFFLPSNWRAVFLGQIKVAVYLASGQVVYVKCKKWHIKVGKDEAEYTFTEPNINVLFLPTDIVAVRSVDWWR